MSSDALNDKPDAPSLQSSRVTRETLTRQLEDALRTDIVLGILRPGERLRTQEMERRYGVSATPLREVFQGLAASGLLTVEPGFGARVAPASLMDLHDVYNARFVLELDAMAQSIRNGDAEWQETVERDMALLRHASHAMARQPTRENALKWSVAHRAFHFALLAACSSQWMIRFITVLYEHSERYRMLTAWGDNVQRDTLAEHETICRLALERDEEQAVAAMRRHLEITVQILEQHFG